MNEFIARKGLISLRSSSFGETLHVQGNIDSPVEAFITSSWSVSSSYTITSSYSDTSLNGGVGNLTARYTFDTSTSAGDPGSGEIRYNSTLSGSVTEIYLSQTTSPGIDATNYLGVLSVGDIIYVQQQNESSIWMKGYVSSSPIDNGSWWTIPFQFEKGGSGGIPDNKKDAILITAILKESYGTYSGSFVGDLTGTASYSETSSYALQAGSSSYSNTASFAQNFNPSATASYAIQALNAVTASYVDTASWSINSITASYVTLAQTASYVTLAQTASYVQSASYATSASYSVSGAWVDVAQTASILATSISYLGVTDSVKTGSFSLVASNTWYDLEFNTKLATSSYFVHPNNTGQFTCSIDGFYQVSYWANAIKSAGGSTQVCGMRILKNGVGWTGSYIGATYASNNTNQILANTMFESITSGSTFLVQIAGDSSNFVVQQFPTSTLNPATISYSAKIIISRM